MKRIALAEIILAGVFWGSSAIFVHYLAPYGVSSLQMTLIRAMVAFLVFCGYGILKDRSIFRATGKELLLFAGGGIAFFGTAACYFSSMQATSVSTAVVLMYTAPIFVMIYSVLFLKETLTPLKTVAVLAMLIGCGLVSGIIGGLKFDFLGILIGLLSGLFFSAYNIIIKIEMCNQSNPMTATFYCFLFASLLGLLMGEPWQLPSFIAKDLAVLPLMLLLGICTCVLPYFLYTLALKTLPAGTASALATMEPMSAALFSIFLFAEPTSVDSVLGIILILGAVFLLGKSENT